MSCIHIQGVRREVTGCAPFKFLGRKTDEARISGVRANAQHTNPKIRAAAAASSVAPVNVLTQLAHDENVEVREWVARNHMTPPQILTWLAQDEAAKVRAFVAWNKSTPLETIKFLCQDEHEAVRRLAATVLDNLQ